MKKVMFILLVSLLTDFSGFSQSDSIPREIIKKIYHLVDLIRNDHIVELASMIDFPIKMDDPIPNIKSKDEFILIYPLLIDSVLKQNLINLKKSDIFKDDVFESYGLLNGIIYFNAKGKIKDFNYRSKKILELRKQLTNELTYNAYTTIKAWKKNVLVCQNEKFLFRIDLMPNDSLRFILWNRPKGISSEPDLMLFNGIQESRGTYGGWTYTFLNYDKSYIIDDIQLCGSGVDCGIFLRIMVKDEEQNNIKFEQLKDQLDLDK
jgi:hypothetical protein